MKKSQSYISIFVLFFILSLVFYSCAKEKEYGIPVTPEEVESLKKDGIEPKGFTYCYMETTTWEFDHYSAKSGKYLGIMNTKSDLKSPTELHNKWGFDGYYISNQTQKINMLNIGYSYANLMVGVVVNNGNYSIPTGTYSKYYIDEPFEKGSLLWGQVLQLSNDLYNINSGAELILGNYRDNNPTYAWYNSL